MFANICMKNVNISNDSRVSKKDVKSFSSQYVPIAYWIVAIKIHHHLKKCQTEAILSFGKHFYHECFLQCFKGYPRVSFFHLNNLDNEVGS